MQQPVKPTLKKPPGYKDPNAPPKPVLPPSFYHQKKEKKSSRRDYGCIFCCCVCASLLLLIVCLAVAGGLFYLWFAPKLPVFRLRSVHFSRFAITAAADGTCCVDARASVWVEVKNPNQKLTVYYGGTRAALSEGNGDTELGSASAGGFTQPRGNVTVMRFVTRMEGGDQLVVDLDTGKRLNATVRSGAVKLKVEVKTKVGIGIGAGKFKVGMWAIDVACGGVSLNKLKAGATPLPNCYINWFSW